MAQACEASEEERRVLLVLADRTYHVREVLGAQSPDDEGALLGFVVWRDDPDLTRRSDEPRLILIPPGQVLRVEILGYDPAQVQSFGF
jgi:hypothetical protein